MYALHTLEEMLYKLYAVSRDNSQTLADQRVNKLGDLLAKT